MCCIQCRFWVCVCSRSTEFICSVGCEQNDFIEGSMTQVKGGKAIVPNVVRVVELARQRGILVVWVFLLLSLPCSFHGMTFVVWEGLLRD